MNVLSPFTALRHPLFARLYAAQTVSQIGDALTWVGLALLAAQLAGPAQAPVILAIALTLRVTALVLLSPLAGVLADQMNRRTHVGGLPFWTHGRDRFDGFCERHLAGLRTDVPAECAHHVFYACQPSDRSTGGGAKGRPSSLRALQCHGRTLGDSGAGRSRQVARSHRVYCAGL